MKMKVYLVVQTWFSGDIMENQTRNIIVAESKEQANQLFEDKHGKINDRWEIDVDYTYSCNEINISINETEARIVYPEYK